jgi:hypothetical protein
MALTDKNIVITPNIGQTSDPKIDFSGSDAITGAQTISLNVYPTSNGTLSFEGSAGQLFSITNDLTGTLFAVNDVSGIPSLEVDADGTVRIAEFSGNILIGTATDNAVDKVQINGSIASGNVSIESSDIYPLAINKNTTGSGVGIRFSDDTANNQFGTLRYFHADVESYGSTAAFVFGGNQSTQSYVFESAPKILPAANNTGEIGNSTYAWANGRFTNLTVTGTITGTVSSVATLATPRNINGTAFDGSEDITTANWGTTRALWGQNVNGSAAITAPLRPAAGSAAAPAFSTSSDTNTGMFFPAADTLAFAEGGAEIMRITSAGNVGIGTTSPSEKLAVDGNVQATDFNSTSDRALKHDIVKIENALDKIKRIGGYTFTYNDSNKRSAGVLAQEIEAVLPEVVSQNGEGYKTVAYGNLISLLIEAIKELESEIRSIKNK